MKVSAIHPGNTYAGPDSRIKLPHPHNIQHRRVKTIKKMRNGRLRLLFELVGDRISQNDFRDMHINMTPAKFAEWAIADVTGQYE